MIACSCYYMLVSDKTYIRSRIWFLYSILFSIALYFFVSQVAGRIHTPAIWDFSAFYLYGKVAYEGYNFYLPENFHLIFNSLNLPFTDFEGLVEYVVNVGFPYPPPTIIYFLPLGLLPYKTALIYWTIFNLLFVFGSIYLVYIMFFKSEKINGLMLVTILFFIFPQVQSTIFYSQTNFIVLFYLLLMKKYADHKFAGIILALAFLTKPYMIIFGLFFLLTKKWKTLIYFITSSIFLFGVTIILFGKEPLLSYLFNNPTHRLPIEVYSEGINQSLQAILLRQNIISIMKPEIYGLISLGTLLSTTVFSIFLLKRKLYDYIWAILLLSVLIIYPGTLSHYAVLLLFIIFHFFDEKKQLGFDLYLNIPIIGIFYYLALDSVFKSMCFLLIIIILKLFWPILPFDQNAQRNLSEAK